MVLHDVYLYNLSSLSSIGISRRQVYYWIKSTCFMHQQQKLDIDITGNLYNFNQTMTKLLISSIISTLKLPNLPRMTWACLATSEYSVDNTSASSLDSRGPSNSLLSSFIVQVMGEDLCRPEGAAALFLQGPEGVQEPPRGDLQGRARRRPDQLHRRGCHRLH